MSQAFRIVNENNLRMQGPNCLLFTEQKMTNTGYPPIF